jgi:alanine dehydrogenase
MHKIHLWLRSETKDNEFRTPITPIDAKKLIEVGCKITVEKSVNRCFSDREYKRFGCEIVGSDTWISAPIDAFIVGIKELPNDITEIKHRHIYFAHCYKNQSGSEELINKFKKGGGQILDIEYLTNNQGVRLAAFGKSAGIAGTLIAMLVWLEQKQINYNAKIGKLCPIDSVSNEEKRIIDKMVQIGIKPKVLVIGAKGRVGTGSCDMLKKLEIKFVQWNRSETEKIGICDEILDFDILINCINLDKKIQPFITKEMLNNSKRKLTVCVDISCDYLNPNNPIAVYSNGTTFELPVHNLIRSVTPFDIVAIDNLPSYTPKESSEDFSKQFYQCLIKLGSWDDIWKRAEKIFLEHVNIF